jgi:hypothetical protein
MNANELADINEWSCCAHSKEVSAMLRQQQAEIESLKAGKIRAYDNGYEDGRKPDTNPKLAKTLTDEEIYACFHQYFVLGEPKPTHYELEYEDLIEFARAILRKAQEK